MAHPAGGIVEHVDEFASDDLSLSFRICHTPKSAKEPSAGVNHRQIKVPVPAKDSPHALHLPFPQKPIVHENATEPVADRLVEQGRGHTRVHSAAQTENDPAGSHLLADLLHGPLQEGAHGPGATAAADFFKKVLQNLLTPGSVGNLRVELQPVDVVPPDDGVGAVFRGGDRFEPLG